MKINEGFNNYNEWLTKVFNYDLTRKEYELFNNYFKKNYLRFLPTNRNAKILDIGCGLGQFLYFLRDQEYKNFVGIDLDEQNIKQCKKIGLKNVYTKDMFKFFSSSKKIKYDAIILNDVIEHIPREETLKFLKVIKQNLKLNGVLIVKTVNCNNVYGLSSYFSDFTHVLGYSEKKIKHVALLAGFRKCEVNNLYIHANIIVFDQIFNLIVKVNYFIKHILFYMNGRIGEKVFSKNLLAILTK